MMSRENLCQPILSIDLKKSLIRIHRNTLRLLGDPDYIQLLINPNSKMIAIKAGDKRDYLAHKVRKYRFETGYSYELYKRFITNHDDCRLRVGIWKYFPLIWAI